MGGAQPLYLSAGFVMEEGFAMDDLKRIIASMSKAAAEAGVNIVTGDTKIEVGKAMLTAFISIPPVLVLYRKAWIFRRQRPPRAGHYSEQAAGGSFDGGDERTAWSQAAGGGDPSDCAPLNGLIQNILQRVPQVAVLRDPTRGGLAAQHSTRLLTSQT